MEAEKFKSNYGFSGIVMFVIFSIIVGIIAYIEGEWNFLLLYPFFFFLIPFIFNKLTNYKVTSSKFILEQPYQRTHIDLQTIKEVEIKTNNNLIHLLYSQPKIYVYIKYNKFDEMKIFPDSPEIFKQIILQYIEDKKVINS